MWLSIFLLAFLAAVTYTQAIQGLTSAALMTALTVLSLALAFATYEYVASAFLVDVLPEYAHAIALVVTFLLPLTVLRLLLDTYVGRANLVPHLFDKLGAGVLGFFTAYFITGLLAIAVQLMPWGRSVLGFQRFDPAHPQEQNELWLQPDRFTASFAGVLSAGVFGGQRPFTADHPDFVSELGYVESLPLGVQRFVPADAVSLVDAGRLEYLYDLEGERNSRTTSTATATPVDPRAGHYFTRLTLLLGSAIKDSDDKKRFTPACVRLVGELANNTAAIFPAIATVDPDDPNRYVRIWRKDDRVEPRLVEGMLLLAPSNDQIDVAFEIPSGFEPRFVAFKRGARVAITRKKLGEGQQATAAAASSTPPSTAQASTGSGTSSGSGGRVSGVRFKSSHFGDGLPMTMTSYTQTNAEIQNRLLQEGQLSGALADQSGGRDRPVDRFNVPTDKALLQLNVESLKARSTLGRALNFSRQTVENYILEDDQGNQHTPVGKYARANVGGQMIIELQYFPDLVTNGGRIRPFERIKNTHLKGDYELVYLFLLDRGRQAVKFSTGGSASRPVDLAALNLVAR